MLTDSQKKIIALLRDKGGAIKKQEAVDILKGQYYHNAEKYVGDILSRMVKAGLIKRVKKGCFELCESSQGTDKQQLNIF